MKGVVTLSEDMSTVILLKCEDQKTKVVSDLLDQIVKKHPDFTLPTAGPSTVEKKIVEDADSAGPSGVVKKVEKVPKPIEEVDSDGD